MTALEANLAGKEFLSSNVNRDVSFRSDGSSTTIEVQQTSNHGLIFGKLFGYVGGTQLDVTSASSYTLPELNLAAQDPLHVILLIDTSPEMRHAYDPSCGAREVGASGYDPGGDCQTRYTAALLMAKSILSRLSETDRVSALNVSATTKRSFEFVQASDTNKDLILEAIEQVDVGLGINRQQHFDIANGMQAMYEIALKHHDASRNTAVVLLSGSDTAINRGGGIVGGFDASSMSSFLYDLSQVWYQGVDLRDILNIIPLNVIIPGVEFDDPPPIISFFDLWFYMLRQGVDLNVLGKGEFYESSYEGDPLVLGSSCLESRKERCKRSDITSCLQEGGPKSTEACTKKQIECILSTSTRPEEYAAIFMKELQEAILARFYSIGLAPMSPLSDSTQYNEASQHRRRNHMISLSEDFSNMPSSSNELRLQCGQQRPKEMSGRFFNPTPYLSESEREGIALDILGHARRDLEGQSVSEREGIRPHLVMPK